MFKFFLKKKQQVFRGVNWKKAARRQRGQGGRRPAGEGLRPRMLEIEDIRRMRRDPARSLRRIHGDAVKNVDRLVFRMLFQPLVSLRPKNTEKIHQKCKKFWKVRQKCS